jgi:hypothetical protein
MSDYHKGIDWDKESLGKEPDTVIAKRLFVNSTTVRKARMSRGIGACLKSKHKSHKGIDWDNQPLGEVSDMDLSRTLGVTQSTVRQARIRRGLSVFQISIPVHDSNEKWCNHCNDVKTIDRFHKADKPRRHAKCMDCKNKDHRKRVKTDTQYMIMRRLRTRLHCAMRIYSKKGKQKSSSKYGIDWHEVCKHLGGPPPGKGYEIDHVVPLSFFDLNDEEQIKLAFSPRNHAWLNENNNSKKDDYLPNGKRGREYRYIPLEEKIDIYQNTLDFFGKANTYL